MSTRQKIDQLGHQPKSELQNPAASSVVDVEALLQESRVLRKQNSRLWLLLDRQRETILTLEKDLQAALTNRDKYHKKYKAATHAARIDSINNSPSGVDDTSIVQPSKILESKASEAESPASSASKASSRSYEKTPSPLNKPVQSRWLDDERAQSRSQDSNILDQNSHSQNALEDSVAERSDTPSIRVISQQSPATSESSTAPLSVKLRPSPLILEDSKNDSSMGHWKNDNRQGLTPLERLTRDGYSSRLNIADKNPSNMPQPSTAPIRTSMDENLKTPFNDNNRYSHMLKSLKQKSESIRSTAELSNVPSHSPWNSDKFKTPTEDFGTSTSYFDYETNHSNAGHQHRQIAQQQQQLYDQQSPQQSIQPNEYVLTSPVPLSPGIGSRAVNTGRKHVRSRSRSLDSVPSYITGESPQRDEYADTKYKSTVRSNTRNLPATVTSINLESVKSQMTAESRCLQSEIEERNVSGVSGDFIANLKFCPTGIISQNVYSTYNDVSFTLNLFVELPDQQSSGKFWSLKKSVKDLVKFAKTLQNLNCISALEAKKLFERLMLAQLSDSTSEAKTCYLESCLKILIREQFFGAYYEHLTDFIFTDLVSSITVPRSSENLNGFLSTQEPASSTYARSFFFFHGHFLFEAPRAVEGELKKFDLRYATVAKSERVFFYNCVDIDQRSKPQRLFMFYVNEGETNANSENRSTTLFLYTESEHERDKWVEAITRAAQTSMQPSVYSIIQADQPPDARSPKKVPAVQQPIAGSAQSYDPQNELSRAENHTRNHTRQSTNTSETSNNSHLSDLSDIPPDIVRLRNKLDSSVLMPVDALAFSEKLDELRIFDQHDNSSADEKKPRRRPFWSFKNSRSNGKNKSVAGNGADAPPYNNEQTSSMSTPPSVKEGVFGLPLSEAMQFAGPAQDVPNVIIRCIEYLDEMGAEKEEGIYRLSGSNTVIKALKERFQKDGDYDLIHADEKYDIHAVAGLLKLYLRELPGSILTAESYYSFISALEIQDDRERVRVFRQLIQRLPVDSFNLMHAVLAHLQKIVASANVNKMNVRNIGIVFSPTLNIPSSVFTVLIENFNEIFSTS